MCVCVLCVCVYMCVDEAAIQRRSAYNPAEIQRRPLKGTLKLYKESKEEIQMSRPLIYQPQWGVDAETTM